MYVVTILTCVFFRYMSCRQVIVRGPSWQSGGPAGLANTSAGLCCEPCPHPPSRAGHTSCSSSSPQEDSGQTALLPKYPQTHSDPHFRPGSRAPPWSKVPTPVPGPPSPGPPSPSSLWWQLDGSWNCWLNPNNDFFQHIAVVVSESKIGGSSHGQPDTTRLTTRK